MEDMWVDFDEETRHKKFAAYVFAHEAKQRIVNPKGAHPMKEELK